MKRDVTKEEVVIPATFLQDELNKMEFNNPISSAIEENKLYIEISILRKQLKDLHFSFEKRVEDITKLKIEKQNLEREAQHWQDLYFQQQADISHLMDRVQELQEYKDRIEKLPEYESWVAGFNCGGYHD